jgi:hypothetical protein
MTGYPSTDKDFSWSIDFNSDLLKRAKYLYDWSISLSEVKSEWDTSLPNPKYHNSEKEKYYAEKVNGIFVTSVLYLLYHEFCHLAQGHDSYYLGFKLCDQNTESYAELITIENEADEFAFNMLIEANEYDNNRWVNGLSILFVSCSSLLLTQSLLGIKQRFHPDLDTRMHTVMKKLDLQSKKSQSYCWYLCCTAIKFYFIKHEFHLEQKQYETAEDCFFDYLEELDKIKFESNI